MGVAYFIVLNQRATFDAFVNGKGIAQAEDLLTKIANKLNVKPLSAFFSMSAADFEGMSEDFDMPPGTKPPAEQWFEPDEVLKTVIALEASIKKSPTDIAGAEALLSDLAQYREVLVKAKAEKLKCHLSVDI
jgi:hypothetical protein